MIRKIEKKGAKFELVFDEYQYMVCVFKIGKTKELLSSNNSFVKTFVFHQSKIYNGILPNGFIFSKD